MGAFLLDKVHLPHYKQKGETSLTINMKLEKIYVVLAVGLMGAVMSSCESKTTDNDVVNESKTVSQNVEASQSEPILAIAIINSDTILGQYEFAVKLRDELTEQSVKYQAILRQKESALMAKMQQLQTEAPTLSQFEGQTRQRKLYEEQEKLQYKQEEYSQKLLILEQQYNRDVDSAISEYLSRYCEDKPFQMVLSNTDLGMIRWFEESLEVTDEVLAGLNEEYAAQQAELAAEETK